MKTNSKRFYDAHSSLLHLSNLMTRALFCKRMKDFNYVHSCVKIKQTLFEGTIDNDRLVSFIFDPDNNNRGTKMATSLLRLGRLGSVKVIINEFSLYFY